MTWDAPLAQAELMRFEAIIQHHLRWIEREGDVESAKKFAKELEDLAIRAVRVKRKLNQQKSSCTTD